MFIDTSITSINNGDILRWNGTQFVNSSTLTNDETTLNTGIVVSTGITKTQSVTQNTHFPTSYVDDTDSHIIYTSGNGLCVTKNNWACCACEDPSETCVNHRENIIRKIASLQFHV